MGTFAIILLILYFLPAMIAYQNKKRNKVAITVLNVFAGWTILGWIAALVWAVKKDSIV